MPTWQRPPPPARWLRSTQPAFAGRGSTFEVLEGVWQAVLGGVRQTVFVGADAGGGKSRFVAEAALALHEQGAGILCGSCCDGMGLAHDPFVHPVVTLLDSLRPEETTPGLSPSTIDLLTALTAATVRTRNEPQPTPVELGRALVDALRWAAAERPVVLVLEDLHWAGAAARDLLRVLVTAPEEQQLLVLATTRNAAPDRSLELSRVTSALFRRDDVHRLDLPGLDADEIVDYLQPQPDRRESRGPAGRGHAPRRHRGQSVPVA